MTWGTPVQSFVFLGLLVFELEPMYATSDRQTDGQTTDADDHLMPPPPPTGAGHNNFIHNLIKCYVGVQVSIFGDGTSAANIVRDINNYERLVEIGNEAAVPTDIKSSFNSLRYEIAG